MSANTMYRVQTSAYCGMQGEGRNRKPEWGRWCTRSDWHTLEAAMTHYHYANGRKGLGRVRVVFGRKVVAGFGAPAPVVGSMPYGERGNNNAPPGAQ